MTGIDLPISNLTTLFTSKLWTGKTNDFNGRIYDNEREEGINPELYISGIQYKEKLLNNNVDSTVFFRVTDYDPTELLADVSIYFSVNLATLYPTITTERADAYAIRDAKKWVDWSEFRIVDIIPGKPAFADYFGADQNKHDMQPYFLFRIDTEVSYSIDACEVVTPTTFNLTLSSDANGTAVSSVGSEGDSPIPVVSGLEVAVYGIANEAYYFNRWLRNTIPISTNPYPFLMNQDITLNAEFLEYVQWVFDQSITKIVDSYYFPDFTSNAYNVQIKQSQVVTFNGTSSYSNSNNLIVLAEDEDYKINFTFNTTGAANAFEQLFGIGFSLQLFTNRESQVELVITYNDSSVLIYLTGLTLLRDGTIYTGYVQKIGSNVNLYINENMYVIPLTKPTKAISDFLRIGTNAILSSNTFFKGSLFDFEFEGKLHYKFKEGWGTENIDRSIDGNNATMIGFNETAAWATRSDLAEPLEIYPYTLFQQIADPTKFIRAIYDTDGNPTKTAITGYNKIAEIPANVVSNTGAVYDGIQITGLEVDAIFDEVLAIENSATVEITKDANTVSLLKIKQ